MDLLRHVHGTSVLLVLLAVIGTPARAECVQRAVVTNPTSIYASIPKFATGKGWQGRAIAQLQQGTQIYVCGRQDVAFGFSSTTWLQISFGTSAGWRYGWALDRDIAQWNATSSRGRSLHLLPIDTALAAESTMASWNAGAPPPSPPAADSTDSAGTMAASAPSGREQLALYGPLFVAMLLGMFAKALVDCFSGTDKLQFKARMRSAMVAVLVSPMVFLGFLNAGQFSTSTQTFIVLCLLAFQNGYFWHTVLDRPGLTAPALRERTA